MDSGTASDSMISDESVLALYGNNKTTATTHYSDKSVLALYGNNKTTATTL